MICRELVIEKFVLKYREKINKSDLDNIKIKANNIIILLQGLLEFKILIQYTLEKTLFFTILKNEYEIHLEYSFETDRIFYSFYKEKNCIEIGNNYLLSVIERIYSLLYNYFK